MNLSIEQIEEIVNGMPMQEGSLFGLDIAFDSEKLLQVIDVAVHHNTRQLINYILSPWHGYKAADGTYAVFPSTFENLQRMQSDYSKLEDEEKKQIRRQSLKILNLLITVLVEK